jgi:hypothetical protein
MGNSPTENILMHINAIESNLNGIAYMPSIIMSVMPRFSGQNNESGITYFDLDHEYQKVNDFIGAAYILTSFLSMSNYHAEQIDFHTKKFCGIIEGQAPQNTINHLYANVSGRFFLPDPEINESLYDLSLTFLNNKKERFNEIYYSNHYAPKGTKYLYSIFNVIKDYFLVCDPIQKFLDTLKKSLQ